MKLEKQEKQKKKISVTIPCWSEEKSVHPMYERLTKIFANELKKYDYEIIFVDDCSPDNTWKEIKKICEKDKHVKGIKNAKNFGYTRNVFATLLYGDGDATFTLSGDLEDPPELLIELVKYWEEGYKVILGQISKSDESKIMYWIRSLFYKIIDMLADSKQLAHFTGCGLYDKKFIDVLRSIDDSYPYLKGIITEFAMDVKIVQYKQEKSLRGKSGFNFMKYYDVAMHGITSYTKILMRIATFLGAIIGLISIILSIVTLIGKICNWESYAFGTAMIIIGVFFFGAVQLFFLGILGEYILSINTRTMRRPLVVIGEKVGFEEKND